MDAWIALARGPLFRVALAACLLGLAYHLGNTLWMLFQSHRRSTDKELALGTVLKATAASLLPLRGRRPIQTVAGLAHGIKNIITGLEGGMYVASSGMKRGDEERIRTGWDMPRSPRRSMRPQG